MITNDSMSPELKSALNLLSGINPNNLHRRSNATNAQRMHFESIWYRHSPDAARYFLLPSMMKEELLIR